ncbi:MAG: hypothetical protein JST12_04015 [Armatimonadetes bacterium]|nr:hypothetical protein [Armatimonadota bacterium]
MLAALILGGVIGRAVISPQNPSLPKPGEITYSLDDQSVDMNHSYLEFKWTYVDKGPMLDYDFDVACINRCNGEKHFDHKFCDLSCDSPCTMGVHQFESTPIVFQDDEQSAIREVNQGAKQFGFSVDTGGGVDAVDQQIRNTIKSTYYVHEQFSCWNHAPCSTSFKGYFCRLISAKLTYQFYRLESDATGREVKVSGPEKTVDLVSYRVADKTAPFLDSVTRCLCDVVKEGIPKEHAYRTGGLFEEEGNQSAYAMKDVGKFGVTVSFASMNSFTMTASNPTNMPVTLVLEPGTICTPDKSDQQTMCTTKRVELSLMPKGSGTVTVPFGPMVFDPSYESADGYGACINMHKKMPDGTAKYTLSLSDNPAIVQLADFASHELIQGPWTQTRFWIVSDHASLDEVRKVLLPRPTEGIYVRGLYDIASHTDVDLTDKAYRKCMEPRLIVGSTISRDGTAWFVRTMAKIDAKGFGDWVTKNAKAFAPLFAEKTDSVDFKHAVDVELALSASDDASLRAVALDYLRTAVPEANRADFCNAGGLDDLGMLLQDDALRSKALDVAALYPYARVKMALCNLPASASGDDKAKASALIKALKG